MSILNRTTHVNHDGTWILPTVPANFGPVRARASCVRNGVTLFGQSDLFILGTNQSITLPHITLGNVSPIPAFINVTAPAATLTQAGQTTQLTAIGTYAGGITQNITAASTGTQYQVSNTAIATVSANGLVTAVSSGNVVIQAINEGAQGIINIHVVIGGASNGGIPNSWILSNFCPNFSQGSPCPQLSDPTFASEDADHDGLTNLQEFQLGTDPNNPDTDGDGLTDGQEALIYHTNPLLASTDGTGIPDGVEVQTGTLGASLSSKLAAGLASIQVQPSAFTLTVNSITSQTSQQLTVTGHLIDGKTTIDLTSTQKGTNYASSDLTICNFGSPDGNVFAGNNGICTITVTNSGFTATATATVTGFTPIPLSWVAIPGYANNVDVNGNSAYVAAGSKGLQIVDVTDRSHPKVVSALGLPGNANDIKVVGRLAYVAADSAGIRIIDVTNPLAPQLVSSVTTPGVAWCLVASSGILYVADGASGLQVIDVSNPGNPFVRGSLALTGTVKGVDIDPSRNLVVAVGTAGLFTIDVTNPAAPALLGSVNYGGAPRDVAVRGNFAFVADLSKSLSAVDISNAAAPVYTNSTDPNLGGLLQDVVISGNFALGADVLFANGVPIVDIGNAPTLLPRAILDFPVGDSRGFRADDGIGIAADAAYVYLTAGASAAFTENGVTGDTRLYIGQYRGQTDIGGIAPTASIAAPLPGATFIERGTIPVRVNASDDVAVAAVNFLVNGQVVFTVTTAPYQFSVSVPAGVSSLTLGATAVDFGGNIGTAPNVVVNVIPDPGTTVIGRALDGSQNPIAGATVTTQGKLATTGPDGRFSIPGVPSIDGNISVRATAVIAGLGRVGSSAGFAPVQGGTTNVGDIVVSTRTLLVVGNVNDRTVSVVETALSPPAVVATLFTGLTPQGVSITPDGSKALVVGQDPFNNNAGSISFIDLNTHPPSLIGSALPVGCVAFCTATSIAIRRDGRFAVVISNGSFSFGPWSIDIANKAVISTLNMFASSAAIASDNRTVIVADTSISQFRILTLSDQGVLSDTGRTVPHAIPGNSRPGVNSIVVAPNGRFALVTSAFSNNSVSILRIDAQGNVTESAASIPICCGPTGIAFTLDGTKAYVADFVSNDVAVLSIDANDNVTDTGTRIVIPNGLFDEFKAEVLGIAIGADRRAYISNEILPGSTPKVNNTITILDTNTNTIIGTVTVGRGPDGLDVPR